MSSDGIVAFHTFEDLPQLCYLKYQLCLFDTVVAQCILLALAVCVHLINSGWCWLC